MLGATLLCLAMFLFGITVGATAVAAYFNRISGDQEEE